MTLNGPVVRPLLTSWQRSCTTDIGPAQPVRDVLTDQDVGEAHLLDLRGEGTLRQGFRHSPRPCGIARQQLSRKLLVDREVGDGEASIRPEDTTDLGQDSKFPRYGNLLPALEPVSPQTCGKVERFHQTLKRWLAGQEAAASVHELRVKLDRFGSYSNEVRPHRAIGRRTRAEAFTTRPKAAPRLPGFRSPNPLPGPTGQGRHHRHDHASPQLAASPHRAGTSAHRHPGARARGRPRRPDAERRRGADP